MKTFSAFLVCFIASSSCFAADRSSNSPVIGALPYEQCTSGDDQRYWFPRIPPFVGYTKGERTTAGGDGTCYLGFPNESSKSAVMLIDNQIVKLNPIRSDKRKVIEAYSSKDSNIVVEVWVTGYASTCVPSEDKCCGDYTYAQIVVTKGGTSSSIRAARYTGG